MSKLRFGIVGCGTAALPVAEAIAASRRTALAMVHDTNPALARDLGERYQVPQATALDELLANSNVAAVYIAVPHYLLSPLAQQALEAGKHVLVEKPMALTLAEADALIRCAQSNSRTLGVFYEMRYAPGFRRARELVRAGALGKLIGVRIQTLIDKPLSYWQVGYCGRSVNGWRGERAHAGGGVVLMNTSHLLDALCYVTGLNVVRVSAETATLVAQVEVEDTAAAVLRFDNGAVGSLFAGAHLAGAKRSGERFEIYGTRGTMYIPDPYRGTRLQMFLRQSWHNFAANTWVTLPCTRINTYARAINDFARTVETGGPAPIDGHAARRVLQIVLGIYQSAAQKRSVEIQQEEVGDARS